MQARRRITSRGRRHPAAVASLALPLVIFACDGPASEELATVTGESHGDVSLPNSNFEIDTDANLVVDHAAPSIDWASVTEIRQTDQPSGTGDDSFGQGAKEDTQVPEVVSGSIPPNKSDLKTFGVYLEENANGRFLHLFWHRVQDPTGTTNMDFEFNKSETISGNDVTPVRSAGDLLIQYDLANGGTHPELFLSRWVTTGTASVVCEASNKVPCWGKRTNLTAAGDATGSINLSPISAANADGLGAISARTFGEATIDFDVIAGSGCTSFGSAYLKSRSSDSFTAAMKDFIAPTALNLNSCGALRVVKTRKHAADGSGDHPHAGVTFTVDGVDKQTDSNGVACWDGLAPGTYTVTETVPTGYHGEDPKDVVVTKGGTCTSGYASVAFKNTPLSNITVSFASQVTGGTAAKISCTGLTADPADATPNAFDDTSETFKDLEPGTYSCTIVVDP